MSKNEKKEVNPIDALFDQNNTDNIVLYNEKDEPIEFEQIAIIPLDGKTYAILHPLGGDDPMPDDEALVFVIDEVDDEDVLLLVDDEQTEEKVFEEYYKLADETDKK